MAASQELQLVWHRFFEKYGDAIREVVPWKIGVVRFDCAKSYVCYYDIQDNEFESYTFLFTKNISDLNHLCSHLSDTLPDDNIVALSEICLVDKKREDVGICLTIAANIHPLLISSPCEPRN